MPIDSLVGGWFANALNHCCDSFVGGKRAIDPAVAKGLQGAPKAGVEQIMAHFKKAGTQVNGWQIILNAGEYGTDYLQRAFLTAIS